MVKLWGILLFGILVLWMAGCSSPEESSTSPASTSTPAQVLQGIPTFGVINLPTQAHPTLIANNDPRLPIAPDAVGQTLYEANCASCHGVNGEGQYPDDPYKISDAGLAGAPPHNPTGHTWHHPDQVLVATVYNGQNLPNFEPMPAFKEKLSIDEIISVIAYIKTWWGPEELEVQRGATDAYNPS
jgi:mono/diheme cytochrome c family protein